jgi:4-amino-4-deoxy-L-arabinose transferase-like glycosyltransferase
MATLLPTLVAAVVVVLYFRAQPHGLADPDAQDYAQLGRQLAAGRGPTTRSMPWNGLDYLSRRAQADADAGAHDSWPNIVRFPLTPFLMAVGFAAFGPSDEAVHLPAGLAFVLTAGCAGLLGARAYGPWAGLTAGLTAAFLPLLVNYSLTGLTEPLLGLLLLGVLVCVAGGRRGAMRSPDSVPPGPFSRTSPSPSNPLSRERETGRQVIAGEPRRADWLLLVGGALFGLAILNRYDTALLALPIFGLWLLQRRDRLRAAGLFLAPAFVVVLPWAVYLTSVAGTPLFNLQPASIAAQASGRADGLGWYLPEYVSPGEVWAREPARALRTTLEELAATPNYLRKLLGWPWLAAGLAACLLALARAPAWRLPLSRSSGTVPGGGGAALVIFLLAAVLLRALLASTLGLNLQRHFVPLVLLVVVVVAGEADWLVRALARWLARDDQPGRLVLLPARVAVAALLVVPGLWTIGPFLVPPVEPPGPPTRTGEVEARPESLARLAQLVGPDQLVASNVPWSVAWQADRRAVPLAPTVEETPELERRFGISVDAIYLAGQVSVADAPRSWRGWEELRRRDAPPAGYVLAESFPNGGRLFVKAR